MIRIVLTALLMAMAPQVHAGGWFSSGYTAEMIEPVYVSITDGAKGACWTNIGEVKTYINDKLDLAGVKRAQNQADENYYISFIVDAQRSNQGFCYGNFTLDFSKFLNNGNGQIALLVIGESGGYAVHNENLNSYALETVSNFFEVFLK